MPRVYVLGGARVGASFPVAGRVVLGRADDCDVCLPHRSVSRRHARIEERDGRWRLTDLRSRNGTRVNGERVDGAWLADADELVLGDLLLRFRLDDDEDVVLSGEEDELELVDEPAPTAPRSERARARPAATSERALATGAEVPHGLAATKSDVRRAELLRRMQPDARRGLLRGDLAQRPFYVRWLAYLLVAALTLGLAAGAFLLVRALRAI